MIVIGAGMAGLVAAYELARQGHDPIVLEAQNRVGGRVYTLRNVRARALRRGRRDAHPARPRPDPRRTATMFGLELRPFVMGNPKGLVHVGGRRMTAEQAGLAPDRAAVRASPTTSAAGRSAICGRKRPATSGRCVETDGRRGWERDRPPSTTSYTLREFLELKGFSEGAIEMYGVMNFVEADMNNAVIEEFREDFGKAYEDMQEIVGGIGPPAERVLRASSGPDPVRRRGPRHRPGRRLGHGPLQDRGRAATR